MSVIEIVSLALVGLFLLVAVVRLFRKPLKLALRVVLNSVLGLGVLWLLNSTAPVTGLTLGVNWFNALTVGVLGLPGLGLLLLVKLVPVSGTYRERREEDFTLFRSIAYLLFQQEIYLPCRPPQTSSMAILFPQSKQGIPQRLCGRS